MCASVRGGDLTGWLTGWCVWMLTYTLGSSVAPLDSSSCTSATRCPLYSPLMSAVKSAQTFSKTSVPYDIYSIWSQYF